MRSLLALSAFKAAWPASLSSAFFLFHSMNNSVVIGVVDFVFLRCETNTTRLCNHSVKGIQLHKRNGGNRNFTVPEK